MQPALVGLPRLFADAYETGA
ncbi:MAG: hypothetical protein RL530_53, partial [Actinomycetota bacterium]